MRPAATVSALAAILFAGALGGCGDSVYYQTRYAPTSSEQSFGFGERLFWSEDKEVYELPANPPAANTIDGYDDHRQRVDCAPTGQRFKPLGLANTGSEFAPLAGQVDGQPLAILGPPSGIPPAPGPGPGQPLVGWGADLNTPLVKRPPIKVAITDDRPQPPLHSGTGLREPDKLAGVHDDLDWCPPKR